MAAVRERMVIELLSSDDEDVTEVGSSGQCRAQPAGTRGDQTREHVRTSRRRSLSIRRVQQVHPGPPQAIRQQPQQQIQEVVDLTADLPEPETSEDIVIVGEVPSSKRRRQNGKGVASSSTPSPSAPVVIKCPVCLDPIQSMTSTICGHVFCDPCIKAAIKAQKRCPTCRKAITARGLHRIFLT